MRGPEQNILVHRPLSGLSYGIIFLLGVPTGLTFNPGF